MVEGREGGRENWRGGADLHRQEMKREQAREEEKGGEWGTGVAHPGSIAVARPSASTSSPPSHSLTSPSAPAPPPASFVPAAAAAVFAPPAGRRRRHMRRACGGVGT